MKKLRPLGDVTQDLETVLEEMCFEHDMQWAEVLNLVHGWLQVHAPSQQEVYEADNSSPIFYYGAK